MNGKLASKDEQLKKAEQDNQLKDQTIKDLQSKVSNLDESMQAKTQTDEEYSAQIQQLASMYSKMTPSKSAPIIENMTPNEGVLILSAMRPDDRVRVLEKMNPKRAAEVTSLLKDPVPVKDRQTAALQERAKLNESQASKTGAPMSREDVGQTFASMTPRSAATVLLEMQKIESGQSARHTEFNGQRFSIKSPYFPIRAIEGDGGADHFPFGCSELRRDVGRGDEND